MENKYKWLALHIFYRGDANKLLTELIAPFILRWKDFLSPDAPWFFIRYWEDGSHIRLRLNADVACHVKIVQLIDSLSFKCKCAAFSVEKIVQANYNPEIKRYGDDASITLAERHFAASSDFILNGILSGSTTNSVSIQAIKLHLMLLFCTKWTPEQLLATCDFFIAGWLPMLYDSKLPVETEKAYWLNQFREVFDKIKSPIGLATKNFWQKLAKNDLDNELKAYLETNSQIMAQYLNAGFSEDKLLEIVSSLMHMTNNRLGFSNQEEAYHMYVVKGCLQYIYKPSFNF